jgi:hypothetical protein
MRYFSLGPVPLLPLAVGCMVAAFVTSSRADCGPIVAAYEKAAASGRYAMFDAPTMQSAPKGQPFYVRIGSDGYINDGKGLKKNDAGGAAFEASDLKRREQKGEARCETIGDGKVGSDPALGWRIRSNGSSPDPMAIHIWIGKSTGMPLFHAIGSDTDGWRWVYGRDVVAPAVK